MTYPDGINPTYETSSVLEQKLYSADDARKDFNRAESVNGEAARKETQTVLTRIKHAANDAQRSISLDSLGTYKYTELIKKRLTVLGFTVKVNSDLRDGSTYTISW